MTEAQHTPGPWIYRAETNDAGVLHKVYGVDDNLTTPNTGWAVANAYNNEATARLIAAAPELLKVCEEIAGGYCTTETMHKAQAVIAKAKGE